MSPFLVTHLQRLHPHQRGKLAEFLAKLTYLSHGYRPVRFHGKHPPALPAQIDLLCRRGATLVLVEVKYRASPVFQPYAVHPAQQQRIVRTARFLSARLPWATHIQADILFLSPHWPYLRRLSNAFPLTF